MKKIFKAAVPLALLSLGGCGTPALTMDEGGVKPAYSFPVTNNDTPYSQCLAALAQDPGARLPVFAVGEVADRTGQFQQPTGGGFSNSTALSQGVSEMVMSALYKTRKARLVERYDLRIPLAQIKMAQQQLSTPDAMPLRGAIRASDFIVEGALTELNYNIVSSGAQVGVSGIGAGGRTVVINVALDLRVVDSRTFDVAYVTSLQKQIYGYEVQANIFRFFGTELVQLDAGAIKNEPIQLGVRSVVEMGVYQIMTDFLGLPGKKDCSLVKTNFMADYLAKGEVK